MTVARLKIYIRLFWIMAITLVPFTVCGQINRVEPPNWWVDFKEPTLQLLIHGDDLKDARVSLDSQHVKISEVHNGDSPNYLFVDLHFEDNTPPGMLSLFIIKSSGEELVIPYELKSRKEDSTTTKGFTSSDAILLITPDRFANGNPDNDSFEELEETGIDRTDDYARHGGDIQGLIDHLDYIEEMGFTAIWSSPLLINDMAEQSYHGYAITDMYMVDPRFGNMEDYKSLAEQARGRGIKIIMDQVANHCGRNHWWMEDLPFKDWINFQGQIAAEKIQTTNHRRTTNQDIYASKGDKDLMEKGWFVPSMPDLNQDNPFMANYLIQNSIWWIETLGLGGIRQDTYPYPDKHFLSRWAKRIMEEYPEFSIVGEEWSYNPLLVGYWQTGSNNRDGYESNLKSTMDFPLQQAIVDGLNEEEDWGSGLIKIYDALANDFYYPKPMDILLFPDNHDMDRIYTQLSEDPVKTRMAVAFVAMAPRIPQFYYGTEILMENSAKPGDHGLIRTDFPGGWEGDKVNAFTGENLKPIAASMQEFMKELLNFRKGSTAVHQGQTVHFVPENGVYALFRIGDEEIVALILNKNEQSFDLKLERFAEVGLKGREVREVFSGTNYTWDNKLTLPGEGAYIFTTRTE